MNISTIVIENRTDDRWGFLQIKFLLEMAGYIVLEAPVICAGLDNESYKKIIMSRNIDLLDDKALIYNANLINIKDFVNSVIGKEFYTNYKGKNHNKARVLYYNKEILSSLYIIIYLYANRMTNYANYADMLLYAVRSLITVCDNLEETLKNEKNLDWRFYYAYLYLVNYLNEGMLKLRTFHYQPYQKIKPYIKKIRNLAPELESINLLEAHIVRNDNIVSGLAAEYYKNLIESNEFGVRYWSFYALGEIEQRYAENKLKLSGVRYGEDIKSKYYEKALDYFEQCKLMKEDEVRIIYKFALQMERKGHADEEKLKKGAEYYRKIIDIILSRRVDTRMTLEYEYLLKSLMRLGWLYKMQGKMTESRLAYRNAKECWDELANYSLIYEICDKKKGEKIIGTLRSKYKDSYNVIIKNS